MEGINNTQIFDKIFKKVLTLSSKAVINFINGLFETDYPTDSAIDYNWTEFHDDKLKRILADTIITINKIHCYHIEAQTYDDGTIIFRVFEYGYRHAERCKFSSGEEYRLVFPEPKILYIYADGLIPDKYELTLDFGSQGSFVYHVPTSQLKDISISELNNKKMIIVIPFYLMSLRKELKKERTPENLARLKKLIFNDIIGSIERNLELGNITRDDADRLRQMTQLLYHYLYAHYSELEEVTDMTDESLLLPYDLFLQKYNIESLYDTLDRVQQLDEEEKQVFELKKQVNAQKRQIDAEKQLIDSQKQQIDAEKQQIIRQAFSLAKIQKMNKDNACRWVAQFLNLSTEEVSSAISKIE